MAKRRVGKYPKEFRRMAVERLKTCDNIVELSQELGLSWQLDGKPVQELALCKFQELEQCSSEYEFVARNA